MQETERPRYQAEPVRWDSDHNGVWVKCFVYAPDGRVELVTKVRIEWHTLCEMVNQVEMDRASSAQDSLPW